VFPGRRSGFFNELLLNGWLIASSDDSRPEVVFRSGTRYVQRSELHGQPQIVSKHRKITSDIWGTAPENHSAATDDFVWTCLFNVFQLCNAILAVDSRQWAYTTVTPLTCVIAHAKSRLSQRQKTKSCRKCKVLPVATKRRI